MLIRTDLKKKLLNELAERYYNLNSILLGRSATLDDSKEGLTEKQGHWTERMLDRSSVVDRTALRLAIGDFKTILAAINKLPLQ